MQTHDNKQGINQSKKGGQVRKKPPNGLQHSVIILPADLNSVLLGLKWRFAVPRPFYPK